jgi:hypothetical protein
MPPGPGWNRTVRESPIADRGTAEIKGAEMNVATSLHTTTIAFALGAICLGCGLSTVQAQTITSVIDGNQQAREVEIVNQAISRYVKSMGPGSDASRTNQAMTREIQIKQQMLDSTVKQMRLNMTRAIHAQADDGVLSQYYMRDASAKRDTAYRLIESLAGRDVVNQLREAASAGQPPARPPIDANIRQADEVQRDFLGSLGKKIADTSAQLGKDHPHVRELESRYERLSTMLGQVHDAYAKVKGASTSAEEKFYRQVADSMEDSINRMAHGVFDKSPFPERPPAGATGPNLIQGVDKPLMEQHRILLNWKDDVQGDNDREKILGDARAAFGEGRAGAGGVSLHSPVQWDNAPPRGSIERASFENGRLVLHGPAEKIVLPAIDPEYLALSIRCIFGDEGVIRGTLVADDPKVVVIQTGKDQYGEVAWNKRFLAIPWTAPKDPQNVELSIGPAIGLLSHPEPSTDRVTYYGPIRNTRMGRALLDADHVIYMLLKGVDPRTGRSVALPEIPGFMFELERTLLPPADSPTAKPANPANPAQPAATAIPSGPQPWWQAGVWLVWTADSFRLRRLGGGQQAEFQSALLTLEVWSFEDSQRPSANGALGTNVNQHAGEMLKAFPPLAELAEVAKAVTVVRWLKAEGIPVDLEWARGLTLTRVETPDTVRRLIVLPLRDDITNQLVIDKPQEAKP